MQRRLQINASIQDLTEFSPGFYLTSGQRDAAPLDAMLGTVTVASDEDEDPADQFFTGRPN